MRNFLGCNESSKKSTKHGNCRCNLYDKYNHCCRRSCFCADREATEQSLSSALQKYKAEYLLSTIMKYLPDVHDLVEISTAISAPHYLSYSYEPLQSLINDTNAPCDRWIESIKILPWRGTVPVPGIKVYKSICHIPYS